jgi:hypothetical protein
MHRVYHIRRLLALQYSSPRPTVHDDRKWVSAQLGVGGAGAPMMPYTAIIPEEWRPRILSLVSVLHMNCHYYSGRLIVVATSDERRSIARILSGFERDLDQQEAPASPH